MLPIEQIQPEPTISEQIECSTDIQTDCQSTSVPHNVNLNDPHASLKNYVAECVAKINFLSAELDVFRLLEEEQSAENRKLRNEIEVLARNNKQLIKDQSTTDLVFVFVEP